MTVNRFKIRKSDLDKGVTVPFAMDFDESLGREQLIELWERSEMQDNVNIIQDFETSRYSPDTQLPDKHIFYDMQFATISEPTGDPNDYLPDYAVVGISHPDVVDRKNNVLKSFFKFDFYDSPNPQTQRLYFSIVLPVNNGKSLTETTYNYLTEIDNTPEISPGVENPNFDPLNWLDAYMEGVDATPPNLTGPYFYKKLEGSLFELTSIGKNTENYYIQWLKNRDLVKYNIFYMSCKFFNAGSGKIHKFINKVQPVATNGTPLYNLKAEDYNYYQLIFDPLKLTYVFNAFDKTLYSGNNGIGPKVGHSPNFGNPIKFFEYINP